MDNPVSGQLLCSVCRFYQSLFYCEAPLAFCVCRMWVSTSSKCVTPSLLSLVVSFIRGASLYCKTARLQLLVSTVVTVLGVVAPQCGVATLSNCCRCAFHNAVHYVTSTLFFLCGLTDQHKHLTHRHTIIAHHVNKGAQWFKPDITCFKFAFQKLKNIFINNLKIKAGCVICQVVHPTPKIKYESTNL